MANNDTGRLVWYELLTSDPKAAIEFYSHVVGWQTEAWGGAEDYKMWVGSQGPIGGVTVLPESAKAMGAPPHWIANVQVENVSASVAKVKELGGNVLVQESVPTIGTFAVVSDPQGGVITLFTPERPMEPHDLAKPGEFSWHELYTTDHEAAFAFYSAIVGWQKLGSFDMGAMGTYLLWGRDGKQLGGMMTKPQGMKSPDGKEIPTAWMYYVTTDDLDAALARAKSRDARVLTGPMDVPGGQRIVQLMDPQGAVFALVTPPKA